MYAMQQIVIKSADLLIIYKLFSQYSQLDNTDLVLLKIYFINSFAVDFKLESTSSMPAMISFTKSLHGNKTKKKSFLQKVFKKRKTTKKDKTSPENSRKPQGTSMEISPASLTAKQRDELMRRYTLQLRPSAQTGHQSSSHQPTASEIRFSSLPSGNRHSMPVMDDYDSPGSPDEVLLASMAKV